MKALLIVLSSAMWAAALAPVLVALVVWTWP
jgi:hypothetical protein